jgi:phage terminase large subunit
MNSSLIELKLLFKQQNFDLLTTKNGIKHIKQDQALKILTDKETTQFGYGGAAGGAKSYTGCIWLVFMCLCYPGTKYFIGREELKRLKDSTWLTFQKVCKQYGIDNWKLNGQDNYVKFDNGSRIDLLDLKHLPSDPFYERYGSVEFTSGWIEEGGEVDFGAYDTLKSRVGRQLNDQYGIQSKIFVTLNPKKNWCHELFWKPFKNHTLPKEIKFLPALVTDNPFIEQSYIINLHSITDKVKKQRLLFGNFDYDDDDNSLITYDKICDMFTNNFVNPGRRYISADIAITNDAFVLIAWNGDIIEDIFIMNNISKTETTNIDGQVTSKMDFNPLVKAFTIMAGKWQVPRSNIVYDADGIGYHMKKYLPGAVPLHNGSSAIHPEFQNLKTECYYRLADAVNSDEVLIRANVESKLKERIISEFQCIKRSSDVGEKLKLLPKADVKNLIGHSPDITDAIAYRYYFKVKPQLFGV